MLFNSYKVRFSTNTYLPANQQNPHVLKPKTTRSCWCSVDDLWHTWLTILVGFPQHRKDRDLTEIHSFVLSDVSDTVNEDFE